MQTTRQVLSRTDVFQENGILPELADRAAAAGFRYFLLRGKVFELEAGRSMGSSLGIHSLKGVEVGE